MYVLSYFLLNEWYMENKNMLNLSTDLSDDDQKDFDYAIHLTEGLDNKTYFE